MLKIRSKGKIIIRLEQEDEKVNSTMECSGIAKQTQTVLTTLLINFTSLSIKEGKDPKKLIDAYLPQILKMLDKVRMDKN